MKPLKPPFAIRALQLSIYIFAVLSLYFTMSYIKQNEALTPIQFNVDLSPYLMTLSMMLWGLAVSGQYIVVAQYREATGEKIPRVFNQNVFAHGMLMLIATFLICFKNADLYIGTFPVLRFIAYVGIFATLTTLSKRVKRYYNEMIANRGHRVNVNKTTPGAHPIQRGEIPGAKRSSMFQAPAPQKGFNKMKFFNNVMGIIAKRKILLTVLSGIIKIAERVALWYLIIKFIF